LSAKSGHQFNFEGEDSKDIVGHHRTANVFQRKLADRFDRCDLLNRLPNSRADEDLVGLGFIAQARRGSECHRDTSMQQHLPFFGLHTLAKLPHCKLSPPHLRWLLAAPACGAIDSNISAADSVTISIRMIWLRPPLTILRFVDEARKVAAIRRALSRVTNVRFTHTRKAAYRGCLPGKLRSAYPVLTGPNDSFGPFS